MKKLLILLLLLLPTVSFAAVAFDAANAPADGLNNITWSHTVTGSSPALFVECFVDSAGTFSGATYNGTSMTQEDTAVIPGGAGRNAIDWILLNPSTGANNISVTSSNSFIYCESSSYTGVSSLDNHGTASAASATTLTASLTVNTANSWLVGSFFFNDGVAVDAGAGTTRRSRDASGAYSFIGDSNAALAAGSQSLVGNTTGAAAGIEALLVSFAPPATAAATPNGLTGLTEQADIF